MKEYAVYVTSEVRAVYYVEAKTEEEALARFYEGELEETENLGDIDRWAEEIVD